MNYIDILNLNYDKRYILYFLIFLINFSLSLMYFFEVYDNYEVTGICHEEKIFITTMLENSDVVSNSDFVEINGEKYTVTDIKYVELTVDNYGNTFQKMEIYLPEKFEENEIVKMNFYYNEERIITKILKKIK